MPRIGARSFRLLFGSLLVLAMAGSHKGTLCTATPQTRAGQVRQLRPGEIVHNRLTGSEDRFEIRLEAGWFLRLAIVADAPVHLVLNDAEGRAVVNSPVVPGVEIPVSTITDREGNLEFRIRATEASASETGYRMEVREVRRARPDDASRAAADRLVLEAALPVTGSQSEAVQTAVQNYEAALRLYQDVNDLEETVRVLMRSGRLHLRAGNPDRGMEILETAVGASRGIGDPGLEASALIAVCLVYVLHGKGQEAAAASRNALQIARATGDRWLEAAAMVSLGDALDSITQRDRATELYLEAVALWRDLDWPRGEAEALLKLGYAYIDRGEENKAVGPLIRSRDLWRALGDRDNTASALQALGLLHSKLDDKQKALDYYHQARGLLSPAADRKQRAALLSATGWLYFDLGDMTAAADYFQQALTIARSIGYSFAEAVYLFQLGLVSFEIGDYPGAREYYRTSLTTAREIGDLRWVALVTVETGLVHLVEGETEAALALLDGALSSIREHADPYIEAKCLEAIGLAHHRLGNHDRAFQAYREALRLLQDGGYRYREAQTRLQLARLEGDRGNLEQARQQFESAIQVIESVRMDVPGPELRASYFSSTHHYFEFYTDLLMQLHGEDPAESYDADAFRESERGRARSLLDSLAEARVEIREGVESGLLERETDLKRRLNHAAKRQVALPGEDTEALKAIAEEIQRLTTEYEQVRALIRTRSPKYAALTQPEPLTLREVQRELLDDVTILLEYALGEERSYLWAVSADSYNTYRLPARNRVEKSVLRLRELLTAYETRPGETTRERRLRIRDSRTRYWREAAALSDILLGPVAAAIANKRLLIVTDGALDYLPFAALPVPNQPPGENPTPLVVEHELIRLPSASTLAVLRDQTSGRKKAEKWLAVLADPVFDAQDPRVPKKPANRGPDSLQGTDPEGSEGSAGGISYPRLPSTRIEAEAIAGLAPAGGTMTAVGLNASRQLATSPELGRYRIVHFATHGILHQEHPELSGVALSMFDEQGQPRQGLLRLHDIYNLRLPVELVVLSACESYLGKQVRGEGLLGIVRGFMYAGASRVIASLWKVDDLATKELMVRFYRNVFDEGQSPAAALRSAQVEMWQHPDWHSPYYWAAFVHQGEWR